MKKSIIVSLVIILFSVNIHCQEVVISGSIINTKGEPLMYANIGLKGFFDGTTSNELGKYSFKTNKKRKLIIKASYIGYKPFEKEIIIENKDIVADFVLEELANELTTVNITAGAFVASDEKRTMNMRAADIGTTAGAVGDITGAIQTLPGVQTINAENGLFVRGGSGRESKIIIDEMEVQNPYYSPVPDVKQRGRFDPFMFSGTVFSSGGYSALYGQALSSTLVLTSKGLADSTNTGGGIYAYGANLFHVHRWKNTSVYLKGEYNNMDPYHKTFPQITDWVKSPENLSGKFIFRHKFSKSDIFKFYYCQSGTKLAINNQDYNQPNVNNLFSLTNKNLYINSTYKKYFKDDQWSAYIGASYSKDEDDAFINKMNLSEDEKLLQTKMIITNRSVSNVTFNFGVELHSRNIIGRNDQDDSEINEFYFSDFIESNWLISKKLAARVGLRHEYSGLLKKSNLAPRASFAYSTGEYSQVSLAYGKFYQTPENAFLYYTDLLDFENATHLIVNYQWMKNKSTFRVELFKKGYQHLIKNILNEPNSFDNSGSGYANGIEFFYRNKGLIPNADLWLSYSYLDTKRDYRNYPISATPSFAAKHTFSFVYKHWINKLNSMLGLSYAYSSGRPYYNPVKPDSEFHTDRTAAYHNLDINISKMAKLLGKNAVIFASLKNVLGQDQIFGYHYLPNDLGRIPIRPSSIRSFFIGCFISTY